MDANELRAALKLRGVCIQRLANTNGLSGASLHRVISGHARCIRAEEVVAKAIGMARLEVFEPNRRELREKTGLP